VEGVLIALQGLLEPLSHKDLPSGERSLWIFCRSLGWMDCRYLWVTMIDGVTQDASKIFEVPRGP
jgi:hypothetical protein